ncbi:MAG: transketolase-like TK C-terminal-containing protein, partial [Gemmatimonadales bacterium]
LFPSQKIYSPHGQNYDSVDRAMLLSYKEARDGQILHEGITEAGSMASFAAAGSAYATFGEPMLPVYVFYSMFGFQRTGDSIWSAADQRARGFLIGATAGRTTLNGAGLQHQDGHSLLLAATNPAVISYDPCCGYEIAIIVEEGIRRMLGDPGDDVMYYLTVYNEQVVHPAMPDHVDPRHVLRGLYRYQAAGGGHEHRATLLASGSAMPLALAAQELLARDWDVAADVWSAPGWTELQRDGIACDQWNLRHPDQRPRVPWVTERLRGEPGPFVAVSDYMKAVPGLIADWVPGRYVCCGTDGFGRSDTRAALRRHFGIDAQSVTVTVLGELAESDQVKPQAVADAVQRYGLAAEPD